MKKTAIFIALVVTISSFVVNPITINADNLGISAKSAVLIEEKTGEVLYAKNENIKLPMASTTKIMTTLLCLESGNLDEQFVVDSNAIKVEGSSMGLQEGDTVTKRALCYGMMLPSGNDAANETAVKLGGSLENFAIMMNNRADEIGMVNTNFVTPSGLHDEKHISSAFDMALLTREALSNKDFCDICCQDSVKLQYGNPPYDRWLKNSNKLLSNYGGCVGVKTGFTDEAGRCLISAAEKDGVRLICVTLNAPDDWNDHKKMLDYGFSCVKKVQLETPTIPKSINVVGSTVNAVDLTLGEVPSIPFKEGCSQNVTYKVLLPAFIYAPTNIGDTVGTVAYVYNGKIIAEVPITTTESAIIYSIPEKKSFFRNITERFKDS